MLHENTPSYQRSADNSPENLRHADCAAARELIHNGFSRAKGFLAKCVAKKTVDISEVPIEVSVESDDSTVSRESLVSKILHPVKSLHEALHGLTIATGSLNGMPTEEYERLTGLDYQEESLFRSIGKSATHERE